MTATVPGATGRKGIEIERAKRTQREFTQVVAEMMREKYGDQMGNFDLRPILSQVEGYSYEALRLMLKRDRTLNMAAIEGIAKVLDVSPHHFLEYRRMWCAAMAQRYPDLVDVVYEATVRFLEVHEDAEGAGEASGTALPSRATRGRRLRNCRGPARVPPVQGVVQQ
jgi:hypothetical protein